MWKGSIDLLRLESTFGEFVEGLDRANAGSFPLTLKESQPELMPFSPLKCLEFCEHKKHRMTRLAKSLMPPLDPPLDASASTVL